MIFKSRINDNERTFASSYSYEFIEDYVEVIFYQSGNGDLNLIVISNDINNPIININRNENYKLFYLFDEFYKKYESMKSRFGYQELFLNGYFSWQSDAPANEEDWDKPNCEFIYNYLNIYQKEDNYELEFINNIKKNTFVIEFNTDRSRYGSMVFPVWELFNSLKTLHEPINDGKSLAKKIN